MVDELPSPSTLMGPAELVELYIVNGCVGLVVPIPTLQLESIRMRSVLDVKKVSGPPPNVPKFKEFAPQ